MNRWIRQWFSAKEVAKGGVVRRKRATVEKFASLDKLLDAARGRGFHVLEVGEQIVVLCNPGQLRVIM